jgi:hypothetical protein
MSTAPAKLLVHDTPGIEKNEIFEPKVLAEDLGEVRRIYANFFAGLSNAEWDRPVKGSPEEWNLHETVAHLCALNGAGLESIYCALQGEPYVFEGLNDRYGFHDYNLRGIEKHRPLPREDLCAELLEILDQSAEIAGNLEPGQSEITNEMPIYNRPVKITEALSIILFHSGLTHAAQVAEPAGLQPLWVHLSSEIRHRMVGRVMSALSLLYRHELGGDLKAVIAFGVDGEGGGDWYVQVSPEACSAGLGRASRPNLTIRLRNTETFCKMFTSRLNLLLELLTRRLRLSGDVRLFLRMGSLFSVDGRH